MQLIVGFGIAVVLTPAVRSIGVRLGLFDRPGEGGLKIHTRPVPPLGGIAVVAAILGTAAVLQVRFTWTMGAGVLLALATGQVDDFRPLPAWTRVLLLSGSAGFLVAGWGGPEGLGVAGAIGLILLVVVCANAVNIVDGQDGLAAGLAAISALGLAVIGALKANAETTELGLALAGALMGFLAWNRPPSAWIFLGNGGAYATGLLLAVLAARVTEDDGLRGLLASGVCLGPFAFEVLFSVARRSRSGVRLSGGDRSHSYDLLADINGRAASTLTWWVLGSLAVGVAVLISILPLGAGGPLLALGALLAALWGIRLFSGTRLRNRGEHIYAEGQMASGRGESNMDR